MFKWLLISKYLRRKLAPLFAGLAVMLCTAMVIIVLSVMGGFLDLLSASAHRLTGDILIAGSYSGMPHYEQLIDRLHDMPQVQSATPIIRGYGLLQIASAYTLPVMVEGIRPHELDRAVGFSETLLWDRPNQNLRQRAMDLHHPDDPDTRLIILGVEVNPRQSRDELGRYDPDLSLVDFEVTLTVLPVSRSGMIVEAKVEKQRFTVVNEFKSGLYEVDANNVYVAFDQLQRMLLMDARPAIDPQTGRAVPDQMTPARASEIAVKITPGIDLDAARDAIAAQVNAFADDHPDVVMPRVMTWQQRHETLLSAVKNEKGLVTFLFVIISIVAVVMVATTFYMIVLEKTRDIGVLRAIGASRAAVRNLFLGYGLCIGVLGALLGLALAVAVVTHLNEIQALLKAAFGWQMWDPRVYFFERIPDQVDWPGAIGIVFGAVASSVVGALIPAILAARMNPIEALRHE